MKLNNKILLSNIFLSILIFIVTSMGMYVLVKQTIYEELDNHLLQHKYDIDKQLDENPESLELLTKLGSFISNEWIEIEPFDGTIESDANRFSTVDTIRTAVGMQSPEAYRRLETTVAMDTNLYSLTIYEEVAAWNRISMTILISILTGLLIWVVLLYFFNQFVFNQILAPFYDTVDTLEKIKNPTQFDKMFPESDTYEIQVLNRALNRMMAQIRSSFEDQRMFIQNASHELLTPLSIIRQKAEKILSNLSKEDREVLEPANEIQQTAVRLSRLSNELLLISRVENKQFSLDDTIDVQQVSKEVIGELSDFIKLKNLIIETHFEKDVLINGNKELIHSAIYNILQNAVKFSPSDSQIEITISRDQEGAFVSIEDNGPGIPPSLIDSVFDRFKKGKYTPEEKEKNNGTGLGLSIVKSICQLHGFSYQARNSSIGGAQITIRF